MSMVIMYRSFVWWYRHGLVTWLWVGLADLTYAIITFTIWGILVNYLQDNVIIFRITSACVLLLFGIYMLKKSISMTNIHIIKEKKTSLIKDFTSAYGLTIINPMTILLFRGFSWQIISSSTTFINIIPLALLVFIGSVSIQLSIALISGWIKGKITNRNIIRNINIIASIIVMMFACKWLLWR